MPNRWFIGNRGRGLRFNLFGGLLFHFWLLFQLCSWNVLLCFGHDLHKLCGGPIFADHWCHFLFGLHRLSCWQIFSFARLKFFIGLRKLRCRTISSYSWFHCMHWLPFWKIPYHHRRFRFNGMRWLPNRYIFGCYWHVNISSLC